MRWCCAIALCFLGITAVFGQQLPGTAPLELEGDLAAKMVSGIDRYLEKALAKSAENRNALWNNVPFDRSAIEQWIEAKRGKLKKLIGVVDDRVAPRLEKVAEADLPLVVAETSTVKIYAVRWDVLEGMHAEGLLLEPVDPAKANVIALADADMTPEMLAGLAKMPSGPAPEPFALGLAECGCRVLVPTLINRSDTWSGNPTVGRMTNQPHREFIYRMAYEMGRHIIGYEVQKVLAAVDWFEKRGKPLPIGVIGYGEGGLLALYSSAIDHRIRVAGVSGYFGPREEMWREPIYRNVWGLLQEFGDAEIAALIAPRPLIVEFHPGPQIAGPPPARPGRTGATPGSTIHYGKNIRAVRREFERAQQLVQRIFKSSGGLRFHSNVEGKAPAQMSPWLIDFWKALLPSAETLQPLKYTGILPDQRARFDPTPRWKRQFDEAVNFTQNLLPKSSQQRDRFWRKMDTSSLDRYKESTRAYRQYFLDEIVGRLPESELPMNPRSRLVLETPRWKGYEVVLDLYDEVFCYGILLVPNDIKPGEKRPVVVCQHGLEGRPMDVVDPKQRTRYYNSFGAQLADLGYIVFAPQNPYIGEDRFRVLIRKGHPLKISLYSFIHRQHERILRWLGSLDFVDANRIALYGLSYGGKVAMRIGALLEGYCLVICSGDFNEWIWKNINLVWPGSYMFSIEYDMYEFDLASTYNYAEMARLIAPRPFMVERGHGDGVGLDEWVAHEYGRVRRHYAQLKIPERTRIEFFWGGHEIHGQGTFQFLHQFLKRQGSNQKSNQ